MQGCDTVMHLAALIGIPYSYHSPDACVDTNIRGTLNVVQAARELDVERIVHTPRARSTVRPASSPSPNSTRSRASHPIPQPRSVPTRSPLSFQRSFGTPGVRGAAIQYLRSAPVRTCRDPNDHHPDRRWRTPHPARFTAPDPRLQLRRRHGTWFHPRRARAEAGIGEVVNLGSNFEITIGQTASLIAACMQADIQIVTDESSAPDRATARSNACGRTTTAARACSAGNRNMQVARVSNAPLRQTIDWFMQPANLARYKPQQYTI